jgi:hypothetical protein
MMPAVVPAVMTPVDELILQPNASPCIDQVIVRDEGEIVAEAVEVELPSAHNAVGLNVTFSTFTTSSVRPLLTHHSPSTLFIRQVTV